MAEQGARNGQRYQWPEQTTGRAVPCPVKLDAGLFSREVLLGRLEPVHAVKSSLLPQHGQDERQTNSETVVRKVGLLALGNTIQLTAGELEGRYVGQTEWRAEGGEELKGVLATAARAAGTGR